MPQKSLGVMVGRPDAALPPMVEITLTEEDGESHQFWFLPDSARSFAEELVGYADEADHFG